MLSQGANQVTAIDGVAKSRIVQVYGLPAQGAEVHGLHGPINGIGN
jgi:hypothetical protein